LLRLRKFNIFWVGKATTRSKRRITLALRATKRLAKARLGNAEEKVAAPLKHAELW
jgi:hypothetical protein